MLDVVAAMRGDTAAKATLLENSIKSRASFAEGAAGTGGVLVPVEYQWDLILLARNKTFALNVCRVLPMSSLTLKLPKELTLATTTWEDEAATIDDSE